MEPLSSVFVCQICNLFVMVLMILHLHMSYDSCLEKNNLKNAYLVFERGVFCNISAQGVGWTKASCVFCI